MNTIISISECWNRWDYIQPGKICRKSSPYNCVCSLSMSDSKDKYKILSSTKYYGTFLNGKKNLLECEIDA